MPSGPGDACSPDLFYLLDLAYENAWQKIF